MEGKSDLIFLGERRGRLGRGPGGGKAEAVYDIESSSNDDFCIESYL